MCGLAGFFRPAGFSASSGEEIVRRLSLNLVHRGPDDSGTWVDGDAGIALGHRRLSVLDLSPAGHQPMISGSGRYVIAFNGEIYNHLEIRKELEMSAPLPVWRGHSDTETLLSGFDRWGVEPVLKKTAGMFAFALWDRQERLLTLARDRIGEKPLYYGWQDNFLLFGSELKSLREHPAFRNEIDRNTIARYMRYGYIAAPHSIYQNIFKLLPGTYVQFSRQHSPGIQPEPNTYWSLRAAAQHGSTTHFSGSDREAVDELEARLLRSVGLQRVADVSVGAFLSGGIDSTAIAALMQAQSCRPVKTFTIGFHESAYNEAKHARAVADHLGTDHTEMYITPRDAIDVIPKLPMLYDEPFGDSSAIATFLVSRLAQRQVTVSISGDGGDELFGGYTRYQRTENLWRWTRRIPYAMRNILSSGLSAFPHRHRFSSTGWKAVRLANYLSARNMEQFYQVQMSQRHDEQEIVLGSACEVSLTDAMRRLINCRDRPYDTMMQMDVLSYLPDDILVKVDRASMGVSLEARVPMLDHEVVEFALRLPLHMKVRKQEGKWLLKEMLRKYVPDALMQRPKMGFGVPVGRWTRGILRDWAENLLAEKRLRGEGFLNPALVRKQWSQHLNGNSSGDSLWTVLMFQAWLSARAET